MHYRPAIVQVASFFQKTKGMFIKETGKVRRTLENKILQLSRDGIYQQPRRMDSRGWIFHEDCLKTFENSKTSLSNLRRVFTTRWRPWGVVSFNADLEIHRHLFLPFRFEERNFFTLFSFLSSDEIKVPWRPETTTSATRRMAAFNS